MSRVINSRSSNFFPLPGSEGLSPKKRKPIPHEFVLDAIASLAPRTHSMFGCLAVYVKNKIVLILRDKVDNTEDNGVWLATTDEHHESLRREFPSMRSIQVFGSGTTGWQVLPAEHEDFEQAALRACELIVAGDPRIGKIPGAKRSARSKIKKKEKGSKPAKKTARAAKRKMPRQGKKPSQNGHSHAGAVPI